MVVDDEPHIVRFTAMNLEVEGYNVVTAANGTQALETLDAGQPVDLVVLDVMMPEMDGFETLRRIRSDSSVPVIFVTVRGDEADRVAGLDLGADDYITKPFSPRELASRIRALFRRADLSMIEAAEPPRLQEVVVDDWLTINFDQSMVMAGGEAMRLRPTEYRLLYQLVSNPGQLLTPRHPPGTGLGAGVSRRAPIRAHLRHLPAPKAGTRPPQPRSTSSANAASATASATSTDQSRGSTDIPVCVGLRRQECPRHRIPPRTPYPAFRAIAIPPRRLLRSRVNQRDAVHPLDAGVARLPDAHQPARAAMRLRQIGAVQPRRQQNPRRILQRHADAEIHGRDGGEPRGRQRFHDVQQNRQRNPFPLLTRRRPAFHAPEIVNDGSPRQLRQVRRAEHRRPLRQSFHPQARPDLRTVVMVVENGQRNQRRRRVRVAS